MAYMTSLPLNYDSLNVLSENLNDIHQTIRLMSLYLLAQNQDSNFTKVLDWAAKYDSSKLVRNMAIALGGTPPPPQPHLPAEPNKPVSQSTQQIMR
jgi:hypothetical protein